MDTDTDWIEGYLLRDQANSNIIKIEPESSVPAVGEGANFLSIVNRLKFTVWRQSGKKEKISVIVKIKPKGEGRAAFLQETGAFKKEFMVSFRLFIYCNLFLWVQSVVVQSFQCVHDCS